MSEWRPIESAPRDGSEFQAWTVCHALPKPNGVWEPRGRFNPDSGAFEYWARVDYDQDGWVTDHNWPATHWQPQPAPPADPKEEV